MSVYKGNATKFSAGGAGAGGAAAFGKAAGGVNAGPEGLMRISPFKGDLASAVRGLALARQEHRPEMALRNTYEKTAKKMTPEELVDALLRPQFSFNNGERDVAVQLLAEAAKPEFLAILPPEAREVVASVLEAAKGRPQKEGAKPAAPKREGMQQHRLGIIDGLANARGVWAEVWQMLNEVYLATKAEKGAGHAFLQATYRRLTQEFPQLQIASIETNELLGLMRTRRFVQVAVYEDFFGAQNGRMKASERAARLLGSNEKIGKARGDLLKDIGAFLKEAPAKDAAGNGDRAEKILAIFVSHAIMKAQTLRTEAVKLGKAVRALKLNETIAGKPTNPEEFAALFMQNPARNAITALPEFERVNNMLQEMPASLGRRPRQAIIERALYEANRPKTQQEMVDGRNTKSIDGATSSI